jgi:crotonobetainyl-CoA:carnitine CoA-transferase CaiB-like acyl-CoA transferase
MTMLGHIKVVDLTVDLGSYAGVMLAELGAEVLLAAWTDPPGDAAEIAMARRGKQLRAIALDDPALFELINGADILLRGPEALPGTLAADRLAARNPLLIDIAVRPFDAGGAHDDRPATDLTLTARSGLATIVGDPDRAPLLLPGRQAWALAGIQGAIAALTALHARNAGGIGQSVTVSAYRSAVLANYREPLTWEWEGRVGNRTGNLLVRGKSGVRQVWRCADGHVTWALVDNPPMMRSTVQRMADDAMAGPLSDVDWNANLVADMPRETLEQWESQVERWLATKTRAELTALSNRHGMGLSAIDEVGDVLASAHLKARGLWRDAAVDGHDVRIAGPLFRQVTA